MDLACIGHFNPKAITVNWIFWKSYKSSVPRDESPYQIGWILMRDAQWILINHCSLQIPIKERVTEHYINTGEHIVSILGALKISRSSICRLRGHSRPHGLEKVKLLFECLNIWISEYLDIWIYLLKPPILGTNKPMLPRFKAIINGFWQVLLHFIVNMIL